MKIEANATLSFPRELVFATYRDGLVELVPHLPNIRAIEVLEREDNAAGETGVTRLLNLWRAEGDIPKLAQSIIKPDMVAWDDHAVWNENDWTCEWKVVPKFFTNNIRCQGKNQFVSDGDKTTLQIRGELDIDAKGIPGVPRLLARKIAPVIEKFIVALLTPNLVTVSQGLEKYLQAQTNS
jgi:hypothetical protein